MTPIDSEKDPAIVLPYLLGRKISAEEVYEAFGVKRSAYYDQLQKGTLITADKLINAGRHFEINPVTLLLRYGILSTAEVIEGAANAFQEAEEARDRLEKSLTSNEGRLYATRLMKILRVDKYALQADADAL